MPAMVFSLDADRLGEWESWVAELSGPRRPALEDMNARLGLDEHRVYLRPLPGGSHQVVVVQEGPGADTFVASLLASDHEFDRWFLDTVAALHGIDETSVPAPATRRL